MNGKVSEIPTFTTSLLGVKVGIWEKNIKGKRSVGRKKTMFRSVNTIINNDSKTQIKMLWCSLSLRN